MTYDNGQRIDYSDVYLVLSCSGQNLSVLKQKIPMIIELPELHQRPVEERFALINHFFSLEAKNLKRNIEATAEAVKVLLITEFPYNIKELRDEILKACVNAYARADGDNRITVGINDFSLLVQQNLLELKKHEPRLQRLLDDRPALRYDRVQGYQQAAREDAPQPMRKGHGPGGKPIVLYVMHGSGTARSLRDVTNTVTGMDNAFCYDLDLDSDVRTAKEELKKHILNIERGGGIIAIYDMGSIKPMLESIGEETGVKICCLHIPITLLGIAAAQKCYDENDVDMVYHDLCKEMNEQRYDHNSRNSVIITLCHTGPEGAKYLKDYIDQHSRLGIKTIALNISGRKILLKEAMELKRSYHIHAFVGTYDPKLLGIPYIPASKRLNAEPQNVDRTLLFEPVRLPAVDYSRVYGYLQEQLKFASVAKLKRVRSKRKGYSGIKSCVSSKLNIGGCNNSVTVLCRVICRGDRRLKRRATCPCYYQLTFVGIHKERGEIALSPCIRGQTHPTELSVIKGVPPISADLCNVNVCTCRHNVERGISDTGAASQTHSRAVCNIVNTLFFAAYDRNIIT